MIVIGADTHKATHTCGAVAAATGQLAGELTVTARKRVPPKLMGESRRAERTAGKSDAIDALAIARAALREGPETLPAAHLDEEALQLRLLLDHREDIVRSRSEDQQRLRWHLHDLWPELELPAGCLDRLPWLERLARKLSRAEQSTRVRIARELMGEIRRRTRRAGELEAEIAASVEEQAPALLELKGYRGGNRQLNCALHRIAVCQGRVHPPAQEFLARKQAEGKSRLEALRCRWLQTRCKSAPFRDFPVADPRKSHPGGRRFEIRLAPFKPLHALLVSDEVVIP